MVRIGKVAQSGGERGGREREGEREREGRMFDDDKRQAAGPSGEVRPTV